MYEINALSDLNRENFGPILHVVRFEADKLGEVVDAINATGYGLTLGLQSRIDTTREFVERRARVGNFYVNRNQIGAVVESQAVSSGEGRRPMDRDRRAFRADLHLARSTTSWRGRRCDQRPAMG